MLFTIRVIFISLEEESEGTSFDCSHGSFLNGGRNLFKNFELRSVRSPLWVNLQIIVHQLVTEKQMAVTPVRAAQLWCSNQISDVVLNATELFWCSHSVNFVQSGAWGDRFKLLEEVSAWVIIREFKLTGWVESQTEWENRWSYCGSFLVMLCKVWKTHSLNIISDSRELGSNWEERGTGYSWDVVGKVVFEEVPWVLAINRVHSNKTGRVHSISQELETHARSEVFNLGIWLFGDWKSNNTVISPLEDTSEWVIASVGEFDGCNCTLGVNKFAASSIDLTFWHFISNLSNSGSHGFSQEGGFLDGVVPVKRSSVSCNLLHNQGWFFNRWFCQVSGIVETGRGCTCKYGGKWQEDKWSHKL